MKVHSLYLYPVKSLAGIEVDAFTMDEFGPAGDRRWMLVDDEGRFVTQRKFPQLALVKPRIDGVRVSVDVPGEGVFLLQPAAERIHVQVWRDQVEAVSGPVAASAAISRFCGQSFRFVYMPDDSVRRIDPAHVPETRRVGFADGFPFLITNQASLDELNSRLEQPVTMTRFRPNIVVDGAPAWTEDTWRTLRVGGHRFELVKYCSRCVMTTVDPATGTKSPDVQPLRTLTQYRKMEGGVIFGMNAIHSGPGTVRVGDPVVLTHSESD